MAQFLKQSTSVDVPIGPFVDATDGVTPETVLTITQPDIRLKKNGGAWAQKAAAQTLTHEENGWYEVTLDATDTDTIGHLKVAVNESGALPVWMDFHVLAANVYDSLFGAATDKLQVDLVEVGGDAQSATDLKDFADAGYDPATNKIQGVVLTDTLTTYTGDTPQTGDSFARLGVNGAGLSAVPWNAAWDAEVQSEVEDGLIVHRLDELLNADSDIDGLAPPVVGSVFHELMSKTAGSFTFDQTTDSLEALRDRGDAAWTTATGFSTHTAADVWAVATRVLTAGTNIVLAKGVGVTGFNDLSAVQVEDAVWDAVLANHLDAGSTGNALNAAGSAGDPWSTALPGPYGAGTAGKIVGDNLNATVSSRASQASVDTVDDFLDTEIADIQARLPAALTAGGNMKSDTLAVSGDASAADSLEAMLDGTGGVTLSLARIGINATMGLAGLQITGSDTSPGVLIQGGATSGDGLVCYGGAGGGDGIHAEGFAAGSRGMHLIGGAGGEDIKADEIAAIYSRLGAPAGASHAADIAAVKADTAAVLLDTGTDGVVVAAGSKSGYSLAAAGLDSITIETGVNARQAFSPILAAAAGEVSGAGTGTVVLKGGNVATTRITATTDASGNRSAVTLNLPS